MKKSREEKKIKKGKPSGDSEEGASTSRSKELSKQKMEKQKIFFDKSDESLLRELLNSRSLCMSEEWFKIPTQSDGDRQEEDNEICVCPEISGEILPRHEWMEKVQKYILLVYESDPILASILAVKSLNPKDKADECFSVIEKFLKNIIQSPENDKFRRIRCRNPIVRDKILETDGALLFLGSIGFDLEPQGPEEINLTFKENHFHLNEVVNMINSVNGFHVVSFLENDEPGKTCNDGDQNDDSKKEYDEMSEYRDFFKLTSTDLKRNQQLRKMEIEKESTLRTKSMREKETKKVPKSKHTKIRIRTLEGTMVEETFLISDKLAKVYEHLDEKLAKGRGYTLIMPPATPFKDTDKDKTLSELQLFPAILLTLKWLQPEKKPSKGKK